MYEGVIFAHTRESARQARLRLRFGYRDYMALSPRMVELGACRGLVVRPLVLLIDVPWQLDPIKQLWDEAMDAGASHMFDTAYAPPQLGVLKWL